MWIVHMKKSLSVAFCEIFRITFHSTTQRKKRKHYSRDKIVQFRLHEMSRSLSNFLVLVQSCRIFIRIPIVWHEETASRCNSLCTHISVGCAKSQPRGREMRSKEWSMEKWIMATLLVSLARIWSRFTCTFCSPASNNFVKKMLVIY